MTVKLLGPGDEPKASGTVVAVHYGDYRRQEIWLKAGVMEGTWYALGGEGFKPQVVDDPRSYVDRVISRNSRWVRPPGTIPQWPKWADVLARGPVTLLVAGDTESYEKGWKHGRRDLWQAAEELIDDGPPTPE